MEKIKFFCPVRKISRTETFVVSGILESTNEMFNNFDCKINVSDWYDGINPQDVADAIINEIGCTKNSISVDGTCVMFDPFAFELKQRTKNTVLVVYKEYKTVVGVASTTEDPTLGRGRKRNNNR